MIDEISYLDLHIVKKSHRVFSFKPIKSFTDKFDAALDKIDFSEYRDHYFIWCLLLDYWGDGGARGGGRAGERARGCVLSGCAKCHSLYWFVLQMCFDSCVMVASITDAMHIFVTSDDIILFEDGRISDG